MEMQTGHSPTKDGQQAAEGRVRELVDEAWFVQAFLCKNRSVASKLCTLFGKLESRRGFWKEPRYDVMRGIAAHMSLFSAYADMAGAKYYEPADAVCNGKDMVVLYFPNIDLYSVCNADEAMQAVSELQHVAAAGERFRQLVPTNTKQKMILRGKVSGADIQMIIGRIFNDPVEITAADNETTVEHVYDNGMRANDAANSLIAELYEFGTRTRGISVLQRHISHGVCWTAPAVDLRGVNNKTTLAARLKTVYET